MTKLNITQARLEVLNDKLFFIIEELELKCENITKRKALIVTIATYIRNNSMKDSYFGELNDLMEKTRNEDCNVQLRKYRMQFEKLKKEISDSKRIV